MQELDKDPKIGTTGYTELGLGLGITGANRGAAAINRILDLRGITPEQADRLLARDVTVRIPQVEKLVPNFKTYSPELQAQLTSEQFRGMLGKSPTAVKHLNAGNFAEAGKEFLNASDYRNSVKEKTGIAARMKALSDAMISEPTRQKKPAQ